MVGDTGPSTADLVVAVNDLTAAVRQFEEAFGTPVEQFTMDIDRLAGEAVEARRAANRSLVLTSVVSVAVIVLALIAGVSLAVNHSNADVIDAIRSCTEPGGACYDANQARSDQRLAPIVKGLNDRLDREHAATCALFPAKDRPADCPH